MNEHLSLSASYVPTHGTGVGMSLQHKMCSKRAITIAVMGLLPFTNAPKIHVTVPDGMHCHSVKLSCLAACRRAVLLNLRYNETIASFANAAGVGSGEQLRASATKAKPGGGACTCIAFRTGQPH